MTQPKDLLDATRVNIHTCTDFGGRDAIAENRVDRIHMKSTVELARGDLLKLNRWSIRQ